MCLQTVPKTLSPQWREQFDLHLYEETGGVLEITVWDRDTGRRDDFIGRSVCQPELYDVQTRNINSHRQKQRQKISN